MWSYYGTKKRIVNHYPAPRHQTIIEPFCGAAQYALQWWENDVWINDKYVVLYKIWEWLIKDATKNDILSLPDMEKGDKIDDHDLLTEPERYLIGFCINSASAQPKKTVAKYNSWNRTKPEIADNLHKIKHWKVTNLSYDEIPNQEATWFIDPPYQYGGEWYHSSVNNKKVDFDALSVYCKERMGQVMVCENSKADWLPFEPLVEMNGQLHKTMEVIWINDEEDKQLTFF